MVRSMLFKEFCEPDDMQVFMAWGESKNNL